MKSVKLDHLPKFTKPGALNGKINWAATVGFKIPFIYKEVVGELEIISYDGRTRILTVKYNNELKYVRTTQIPKCQIGAIIGTTKTEFRYDKPSTDLRRSISLDALPRIKNKRNYGKIDWSNSVGCEIPFSYGDIEGILVVKEYLLKKRKLKVMYNNELKLIGTRELVSCKIGNVVGFLLKDNRLSMINYRYNIGDVVNEKLLILSQTRVKRKNNTMDEKGYDYKCLNCGYKGVMLESNISKGRSCKVCCSSSKFIVKGINDIWTKAPWMGELLNDSDDGYKYTVNSTAKLWFKCPDCGSLRINTPHTVNQNKSMQCKLCGDGVSYPEKFVANSLKQVGVNFITQLSKSTFPWCNSYRYDIYVPSINAIIEIHGEQHYVETGRGRTLAEEQLNDKLKKELALENGIKHYFTIDCRKSSMEFIKDSLLENQISKVISFDDVNWVKCDKVAQKSLIITVCKKYESLNSKNKITILSEMFNLCTNTIRSYLEIGNKHGWCKYNKIKKSEIICINDMRKFNSVPELSKCNLYWSESPHIASIRKVINGEKDNYKGYRFLRLIDYNYIVENITTDIHFNWRSIQQLIRENKLNI